MEIKAGPPKWAIVLAAVLVLVILGFGGTKLFFWFHDRGVVAKHEEKVSQEIVAKTTKARDKADGQRVRDAQTTSRTQAENYHAIDQADDSAPDAAHVQLGCQRLRSAGATELPPSCGAGGELEALSKL